MTVQGDGPEGQPGEGVTSMNDLSAMLDGGEESDEGAPEESEQGEEEAPEESEGEEVEQPEGEDDEAQQDEPTFKLKHEGKEVELPQSEVVELAQKGFDYTQKTMAVAEERKAVEAERSQAEQYRQQYEQTLGQSVGQLQALERVLTESLGNPPPVSLAQDDVALYIAQKEQYEARRGQLASAREAIANLQDEQARTRQAWIAQKGQETENALKSTLPGWNEQSLNELMAYAGKHGLGQQNFDHAMLEKGFWEMAHKAKAYDELQEKKAQIKPVSQPANKVAPAQAKNQPSQLAKRQEAMKRHRASPSIKTLADLL
jgi:hypothetical protein